MPALRRLAHLIWGAEIDRALRPVLAISLASSIAASTWWTFMGIWAVTVLEARAALPFVFGIGALLAALSGYAGGAASDHFGRRRIMLVGEAIMIVYPLTLLAIGDRHTPGLVALACAGAFGAIGHSVSQALVADVVPQDKHEQAYSAVRVASNLGVTIGPPIGALMLFTGDWRTLFVCVSVLSAAAFTIAFRYLPRRGLYAPEAPPDRGSFGVIRRDRSFLLFMGSAAFAWIVYVAYQEVLPISLVDSYGFAPAAWGLLVIINPLLVTLFQLRLTRSVQHVPAAPRLVVAMLVMGLPFLLLIATASLPVVVLVIVLFVMGEMLWVPTSQSIVAALAPADLRGAYMGAFGSTAAMGFALAPMIGLSVRNAYGDDPMWVMFAGLAVVAALLGGAACEGVRRRGTAIAVAPAGP